jgi:hypothetical protein
MDFNIKIRIKTGSRASNDIDYYVPTIVLFHAADQRFTSV